MPLEVECVHCVKYTIPRTLIVELLSSFSYLSGVTFYEFVETDQFEMCTCHCSCESIIIYRYSAIVNVFLVYRYACSLLQYSLHLRAPHTGSTERVTTLANRNMCMATVNMSTLNKTLQHVPGNI